MGSVGSVRMISYSYTIHGYFQFSVYRLQNGINPWHDITVDIGPEFMRTIQLLTLAMFPLLSKSYRYSPPLSSRKFVDWFLSHFLARGPVTTLPVPVPVPVPVEDSHRSSSSGSIHKFCVDCQYYLPDRKGATYSKCAAFPKTESLSKEAEIEHIVSGTYSPKGVEYYYCSTARGADFMCGKNGTAFQPRSS